MVPVLLPQQAVLQPAEWQSRQALSHLLFGDYFPTPKMEVLPMWQGKLQTWAARCLPMQPLKPKP